MDCKVLGIDRRDALVHRLSANFPCVVLDASDEEELRQIDIVAYDAVVIAINSDIESSVMATAALKRLGVRYIVCQATTEQHGRILQRIGAQRIIDPELEAGRLLAAELCGIRVRQQVDFASRHIVSSIEIDVNQHDLPLRQLDLGGANVSVLMIQRQGETFLSPPESMILQAGDFILLLEE